MLFTSKNNKPIIIRVVDVNDYEKLFVYLHNLSEETKNRFGPHLFDQQSILNFYNNLEHTGYIAIDAKTNTIIAYAILKKGYLLHDSHRLQAADLKLSTETDCTYAPSVADEYQSDGIGSAMFHFILIQLKQTTCNRLILWGGVQKNNTKAINFYTKNHFIFINEFEYNGTNYDMILNITHY